MNLYVVTKEYSQEWENMISVSLHTEIIDKDNIVICLLGFFKDFGEDETIYADCIYSFMEIEKAHKTHEKIEAALIDNLERLKIKL